MTYPAPFVSSPIAVEEAWIDYNGHLNMGYYTVIADRGSDEAFEALGFGPAYVKQRRCTTYAAEAHICYLRELHLGAQVSVCFQLLEADEKRIRSMMELRHQDGWLAATIEVLTLHVDMAGPKVVPFPPDIRANIQAMLAAHAGLPVPARAGRGIALARKRPADPAG